MSEKDKLKTNRNLIITAVVGLWIYVVVLIGVYSFGLARILQGATSDNTVVSFGRPIPPEDTSVVKNPTITPITPPKLTDTPKPTATPKPIVTKVPQPVDKGNVVQPGQPD